MEITEIIPYGKDKAISRRDLARTAADFGLVDDKTKDVDRAVRKLIFEARCSGTPIIYSENGGYYQPTHEDIAELRNYVKTEEHRAIMIIRSIKSAGALLEDLEHHRFENIKRGICDDE